MRILPVRLVVAATLLLPPVLAAVAVATMADPAQEPMPSAFATGPDHAGTLRQAAGGAGLDVQAIVATPMLLGHAKPAQTHLVATLAPPRPFEANERAALDAFLADGGSLLVADATGNVTPWLLSYGAEVADIHLVDTAAGQPDIVLLSGTVGAAQFKPVAATYPAKLFLHDETAWTPLLTAPERVHADLGSNRRIDVADPPGPHVVGAVRSMEAGGTLVVLADHTLLTDLHATPDENANRAFLHELLRSTMPDGGVLVIDESLHGATGLEPAPAAWTTAVTRVAHAGPAIVAGIAALAVAVAVTAFGAVPLVTPLGPHRHGIPVRPAPPIEADDTALDQEAALEILAARTGMPVERVRTDDTTRLTRQLDAEEASLVTRALQGTLGAADRGRLHSRLFSIKGGTTT